MKHSKALVAILVATFIVFGFIGIASAHTPTEKASCSGLTVKFENYEGTATNNRLVLNIDGTVYEVFFAEGYAHTYSWDSTKVHRWLVDLDANIHTGNPTKFDHFKSGVQTPCEQTTTTSSPPATPSTSTTPASPTTSTPSSTVDSTSTTVASSPSSEPAVTPSPPASVPVEQPTTQVSSQPADTVPAVVAVGEPPRPSQGHTAASPRALPATCFRSVGCEKEGGDATPLVSIQLELALASAGLIAGAVVIFVTRNRKAHS